MKKLLTGIALCLMTVALSASAARAAEAAGLPNQFYAMDTGTDSARFSADAQAAMVKELGFAGIDIVYKSLAQAQAMAAAADKNGIRLVSIYFPIFIEKGKETDLTAFKALSAGLKGRDLIFMFALNSRSYKPSMHEGDAQAVAMLRQAAEIAQANGQRVAIYHHFSSWVERADHAVSLVKQADRKNLGVVFNLCHFLKTDGTNVDARIKEAMPVLFAVTICGADKEGKAGPGWSRLIQTLDKGDYDVAGFLAEFIKLGYKGPIGLQHYGIKGDARENLQHSMTGWKMVSVKAARLARE